MVVWIYDEPVKAKKTEGICITVIIFHDLPASCSISTEPWCFIDEAVIA